MRVPLRPALIAALTGALTVSAAWAGTVLAPVEVPEPADVPVPAGESPAAVVEQAAASTPTPETTEAPADVALPTGSLDPGWYYAGASKVSLYPRPGEGEEWVRDAEACKTMDEGLITGEDTSHVAHAGTPWPENPNCIYMGGYGLGPTWPITEFDTEYGLYVRTFALSDGTDPLFLTVLDGEGWFWDYASKCTDCGWKQIGQRLAGQLGTDPSAFIFHATHSHTAMDFIGGWGFVPDWYMRQVTEAIETSILAAVASMEPARLEVGESMARELNRERRETYHSPEEQQLVWLRAYVPGKGNSGVHPARTIATIGTFAAHPTTFDHRRGLAHADWPGVFSHTVEQRFGGIGLHFMTGLGNMSASGGTMMGEALAQRVPELGAGAPIETTDIVTAQRVWNQPTTNAPLTALGAAGFFDRTFQSVPAEVRVGDSAESPCVSASATSVEVAAGAARVGERLLLTAGPGELFSNTTNTIKEKAATDFGGYRFAMPIAQANDALGYLPESFERAENPASGQGGGFATSGDAHIEYEDAYSIDRCFGDAVLQYQLELLREVTSPR